MTTSYELDVNGVTYPVTADQGKNLLSVIRGNVGLTGTKEGCDDCECGACMVLLDGQPVNSCSYLAVQAQGRQVTTIEGVGSSAIGAKVQQAWLDVDVMQCGYCQAGQVMTATALLTHNPKPSDEEIDAEMNGNLCRCATYHRIRAGIHEAARRLEA